MREQLIALYELQELDVRIAHARAGLAALDGAKALKQRLAGAKAGLDNAEQKLTTLEVELKDSELKLKSIDDKRSTFEKRLYGKAGGGAKELQAIEKEVNILKAQQGQLDGRVLELYEQVEAARGESAAARAAVGQVEQETGVELSREAQEHDRLDKELAGLLSEREGAASKITDKQLMSRYEAMKKHSGTGIAKVQGGRCGGCKVTVTPFVMGRLYKDEGFEACENCGRILLLDKG